MLGDPLSPRGIQHTPLWDPTSPIAAGDLMLAGAPRVPVPWGDLMDPVLCGDKEPQRCMSP